VEIADDEAWYAVINAGQLLEQSYHTFGSLFGVRDRSRFSPIAAHRGLPDDASETVIEEGGTPPDGKNWSAYHSHTWISWAELKAVNWAEIEDAPGELVTRQSALSSSFVLVFELMEILARHEGDEKVRLVVWFDS
jgi:hypothetical protein